MSDIDCMLPENMEMDECMDMDHDDHHEEEGHGNPMMANVHYAMTAIMTSTAYSLAYFRYRGDAMDFYTAGDQYLGTDAPNYWKMANTVRLPTSAGIFGVLALTQLLSMFGIAGEINLMAWRYGLMVWMASNMVATLIEFYGYESAYAWYAEDTTNNIYGIATMGILGGEIYQMVAKETAIFMGLYFMMEPWFMGQVKMLPEEQQEKWMEMHGGKKDDHDDHDDDMEFSMSAFFGF